MIVEESRAVLTIRAAILPHVSLCRELYAIQKSLLAVRRNANMRLLTLHAEPLRAYVILQRHVAALLAVVQQMPLLQTGKIAGVDFNVLQGNVLQGCFNVNNK